MASVLLQAGKITLIFLYYMLYFTKEKEDNMPKIIFTLTCRNCGETFKTTKTNKFNCSKPCSIGYASKLMLLITRKQAQEKREAKNV
jgi:protein-arginine kinase activator protein McsA